MGILNHRRRVTASAVTVAVAALLTGCGGSANGSSEDLVLATWQGPIADAAQAAYYDGFQEETGISVTQVPADYGRYVSMLESGNPDWNSYEADGFDVLNWADEGWTEELEEDIPRGDLINPEVADYAVGGYGQAFVLVYRESAFETAPQNWADFWDTEKFPGKRGWPGFHPGTAEAALMADGVPADELYPLDLDRAIGKLDEIRPSLSIYDNYASLAQAFQAGSVDMAFQASGRAADLAKNDPDVKIVWNQNVFSYAAQTITAGMPNSDAMQELARYMSDPERQAEFAEKSGYAPPSSEAFEHLSEEAQEYMPGTPERLEVAAIVDDVALQDQVVEYADRYSTWLAK
jgi:putative spermidine/putrescine transport system substrate-binding protein